MISCKQCNICISTHNTFARLLLHCLQWTNTERIYNCYIQKYPHMSHASFILVTLLLFASCMLKWEEYEIYEVMKAITNPHSHI